MLAQGSGHMQLDIGDQRSRQSSVTAGQGRRSLFGSLAPQSIPEPGRCSRRHSLAGIHSGRSSCYTADRRSWDTLHGTVETCRYDALEAGMQHAGLGWQVLSQRAQTSKNTRLEEGLAVNFLYDWGVENSQVCLLQSC